MKFDITIRSQEGRSLLHLLNLLHIKVDRQMATQQEMLDAVTRANETLTKVGGEIDEIKEASSEMSAEIQSLKDMLAQTGGIPQEVMDAVQTLQTKADELDAKIPDVPVVEPVPVEPGVVPGSSGPNRQP